MEEKQLLEQEELSEKLEHQQSLEQNAPKKKNKITTILSNIMFGIVMVILVVFLGYSIGSITQNKVPSFFGKSYVRILTGSMKASGFNEGDVVMIKKVKLSEIKQGDIIAFYWGPVYSYPSVATTPALNDIETGQSSFDVSIVFHQVAEVVVDTRGNLWVKTFGTSNTNAAGEPSYDGWTKGDRIVGVYEPSIFAGVIQFISSTEGIIAIVIVPSCIVLFILLMRIIDIIDKMSQEKKKNKQENMDKINEINGIIDEQSDEEKQNEQLEQNDIPQNESEQLVQQSEEQPMQQQVEDIEQAQNQDNQTEQQSELAKEEIQEQPVVEDNQTKQPKKSAIKSKKSTKKQQVEVQEQTEQQTETFEDEQQTNADDEKQKTKKVRQILKKEERDEISQQVDELVKKSKTRKKKTEGNQDV